MDLWINLMITRMIGLGLLILGFFIDLGISMIGVVIALFAPLIVSVIELGRKDVEVVNSELNSDGGNKDGK